MVKNPQNDPAYEQWKRENGLTGRGFPQLPVLPSESTTARIANGGASEREDD